MASVLHGSAGPPPRQPIWPQRQYRPEMAPPGRNHRRTLIVFIDDATGRLPALHVASAETTRAYVEVLRGHILAHGPQRAFYSDRHGISR